jgi:biofilm PGA synthesis N-glycosyltransferase PgaC
VTDTYALITPVRDEVENLRRLAACVIEQTVRPQSWIIVDNGSTDDSWELAEELGDRHAWITARSTPPTARAEPGTPIVVAFHAGLRELDDVDVVVKLDADVSFDPTFFEELLTAFREDPKLGIASGECLEQEGTEWVVKPVTVGSARGATRAYRRECLEAVLPLPERVGWDTVDAVRANLAGWRTGTIPTLFFRHHRRVGQRDGAPWTRSVRQGAAARYLGYRPSYLVFRTFHRAIRNPSALGMLFGYATAAARREERCEDQVRAHLRGRQQLRQLQRRAREALGHESGSVGS